MALRKEWTGRLDHRNVVILRAADATELEEHFAYPGGVAATQVERLFPGWHRDGNAARVKLLDFCGSLNVSPGEIANAVETRWLKERVEKSFRRRELLVVPSVVLGGFAPLKPLAVHFVEDVPESRGVYVAYRYDIPFYVGHARKNARSCLMLHLPRRKRAFIRIPDRIVQFDFCCPKSPLETVADVVRRLPVATYGDMRLEPDPVEGPAKCQHKECKCEKYNDRSGQGAPKIRFVGGRSATCSCGHNYLEHG